MQEDSITTGIIAIRDKETIFMSMSPYLKNPRVALVIPKDWVNSPIITLSPGPNPSPNNGRITEKKGTNKIAPLIPSILTMRAMKNAIGNTQIYDTQYSVS